MTHAQMLAIVNPANGLIIYCTDCSNSGNGALAMFISGTWYMFAPTCISPLFPSAGIHASAANQITWNWNPAPDATGYKWNTTNTYGSATDMGTATTKTETGLTCNTSYIRYVWSYNGCGNSSPTSLMQTTSLKPPALPTAGVNIPSVTQIVWNWDASIDATGYKWSAVNNYAGATDRGTATTTTETGLTCNTAYTRYIWAYSTCGSTAAVTLTQATSLNPPSTPTAGTHVPSPTQIVWNWNTVAGATGYKWSALNYYAGATDMGTAVTKTETGLTCNTLYTRYAWAYSTCGNSTPVTLTQTTSLNPPSSPTAGTHVPSPTQIVWNWNAVSGATGYRWSAVNNYAGATDMGTALTTTETGLTCNTPYTRYAWAYSACGNSTALTLIQATSACPSFTCGTSLAINHVVSGGVAPVEKTTTYGTVTNIPGETTKCWITSNLGSDHQATVVNDATEPSAGWYWQFNRKQGFKVANDGTRTPNTTWITSISENSDWITANDPCALEIGNGWRIPTGTEWTNADAAGNWTDWNGPWNSGLKIHAAGSLPYNTGSLPNRGISADHWSSSQVDAANGRSLGFYSGGCYMNTYFKAHGFSLRCIRDNTVTSTIPTVTTTSVTAITQTTATSGGNVTADGGATITARGVCWSTTTGPVATGNHTTDAGTTGSYTSNITGLAAGTLYYVRAYATNSVGTAYGAEVSFTTSAAGTFSCGSSITINHVAGAVAPVNKTVTYGTVTNIPGELTKCWITSNLGADHQATSNNDPTEASAGWYWQFNLKQGYKHDGTTRTPNTTWISSFNENSDWTTANDPCAIELGTGWRIPTSTEWFNVDAIGTWISSVGPWNSGLKLHTGGFLYSNDGLRYEGGHGVFWSNSQTSVTNGWNLDIYATYSQMSDDSKAYGFSLRCIKDGAGTSSVPTVTTSSITNIAQTTATGGGNVTADGGATITARGVCWSTITSPVATGNHTTDAGTTGSFTSNITGLTASTLYYVRAYATNSVGTAYGAEVSFTTSAAVFSCGSSLTINHVAGVVAPVAKSVTYGTVTNIPGELTKCWITSNLGSDHQATAVNDATEASAGWYWQFNRQQGYKHDGTTRTPNTTWIYPISENSDWATANDPCALELGTGWRIPTNTEWTNVDAAGNWTNGNGPWGSGLKLHDAGYLNAVAGGLVARGSNGSYWSSTQYDATTSWYLYFVTAGSFMINDGKVLGCSARCLHE
jgi:hypothetical protein